MNRYYKIRGRIDLRSNHIIPDVPCFGMDEEIYTMQQITRTGLNRAAIAINDIFRKSVSYPTLDWDELDDLHRQSKIVAADHLLTKVRILLQDETVTEFSAPVAELAYLKYCEKRKIKFAREVFRRLEYMRWLRFYVFYNWSYGPVRNDAAKEHPMLQGYDHLTAEQKKERDFAWELLEKVAQELRARD